MNLPIKYRPRKFSEVVGQEHVTRTLYNALESKKVSSAYLFTGPRGIGKTTTARILAKGLNCESAEDMTPEPCNQCSVCIEIDSSRSLDVIEIDGASNRGIDQIRELRDHIRLMPTKGRYRVYIIDEVHMLTTEAFNALLKTLEEPPPHVVFIFATTEPRKVPDTVVSRTQRFDFRPLTPDVIISRLKDIANKEGVKISNDALRLVVAHSEGSMRDAISIMEQLHVFADEEIKPAHVIRLLGLVEEHEYLKLLEAIISKDLSKAMRHVDEILSKGIAIQEFARGLQESISSLLRAKVGIERNAFTKISQKISQEDILQLLNQALELETSLKYATFQKVWVEYYITKMCLLPRAVDISKILEKFGVVVETKEHPAPETPRQVTLPKEKVIQETVKTLNGFIKYLESQGGDLLAEKLKQGEINMNATILKIYCNAKDEYDEWVEHSHELKEELETYFGKPIDVKLVVKVSKDDPRFLKLKEVFKLEELRNA